MKSRIAVILKPPGDGERVDLLRRGIGALREEGHRVSVRVTFEAGDARRFARRAALAGWDAVVAAGGDGTINEVVNGLASVESEAALGIVPLGTANDFARGLGIPDDPAEALAVVAGGRRACVDIARVNRRCFINVSTGGFGADATRSANPGVKRYLGPVAYALSGLRRLLRFEPFHARFRVDDREVESNGFAFFAVGNARQTGGGTPLTPRADVGDGMLDVVLVGAVSRLDLVSLLPDLRKGTHLQSPHVRYFRAKTFEVLPGATLPVNADGELVAGESYAYDVLPQGLPVVMP